MWIFIDSGVLLAHYKFHFLTIGEDLKGNSIKQAPAYVIVRTCIRLLMVVMMGIIFIYSACIFRRIYRVVHDEPTL